MVSALIAVALLTSRQEFTGANLVVNSTLAQDWNGWSSIWTREDGAAKAGIVSGRSDGKKSILVTSRGATVVTDFVCLGREYTIRSPEQERCRSSRR